MLKCSALPKYSSLNVGDTRFPKSCIRELILGYLTIFLYRSDQLEGMHSVLKIVSSAHTIKR